MRLAQKTTMPVRRTLMLLATAALAAPLASTAAAAPPGAVGHEHPSQVVLDWQRTAIRTIYGPVGATPRTPIPVGMVYLGLTSQAVWEAVQDSTHAPRSSEAAAVATAAHDVLLAYFPASAPDLSAELDSSLTSVPDGPAETRGTAIGHAVAAALVLDRSDDGRNDPTVSYSKPAGPGVWQPPATGMLAPWLGSVDYLALERDLVVDGPDAMTSADYTADYDEVRRYGRAVTSARSDFQTETARFYNSNAAIQLSEALLDRLAVQPLGLRQSARLFATMHVSMADTIIRAWELKRDVGFWRPSMAIAGAADDGNPATSAEDGWTPLIPNPPYSDYLSGHGSLTAPGAEAIREELGDDYSLTLHSYITGTARTYAHLSDVEAEALNARIRDAMVDAYDLGHRTARIVRH